MGRPQKYKYTDEDITEAVRISTNVTAVMRCLGMTIAGGSHSYIKTRIKRLGLDTSHFFVKRRGMPPVTKKTPDEILRVHPEGSTRQPHYRLKRALLEIGIEYRCATLDCLTVGGMWLGKALTLQVDHIDGNPLDCRKDNLRFLCPNCHTKTESYGNKSTANRCVCGAKQDKRKRQCETCGFDRSYREQPSRQKIQWPILEDLLIMLKEHDNNFSALGRTLG